MTNFYGQESSFVWVRYGIPNTNPYQMDKFHSLLAKFRSYFQYMMLPRIPRESKFRGLLLLYQFHKWCCMMTMMTSSPIHNLLKISMIKQQTAGLSSCNISTLSWFHMSFTTLPGGHAPQFSCDVSRLSPVQVPPFSSCSLILLIRFRVPVPQVLLHVDHEDQGSHSQLTANTIWLLNL